ncbi:hypothetical protein [Methylobacterium sp. 77]|uniref:hypothetical protein n=1 Tax=Methylobacterium sp. 77 TaxID=1101192 RepID=UPI00037C026C|nr:hypothetical protein [Methylobacterium sp. 77]
MSIEPIGLITLILGLICLMLGYRATTIAFVIMTVMGSAAAILVGGASIQPAHLFIIFLALSTMLWRRMAADALGCLRVSEPGFWLLCLTLYGVASGFVLPRLLADTTQIIPLGASEHLGSGDGLVPLGPVSSNMTQSIYLIGDLLCFVMVAGIASHRRGFMTLTNALFAYAAANIFFAVIDMATSATGTQDLLQFMRNAQYTFHDEESVGDMRRIVGSWPEASAFAGMSLGALGFTGTMWLCGRRTVLAGTLAFLTLAFVVLSTSSTGLVGAAFVLAILYLTALRRCGLGQAERTSAVTVVLGPLVLIVAVLMILVDSRTATRVYDHVDTLVLSKATTNSGLQRSGWNAYAWQNFLDSRGLGVGLGTNRTSSFPLAVLSNVGLPGAIFYLLFAASALGLQRGVPRSLPFDVRLSARNGCLGLLVAGLIAGPTVDQGLLFYVLAALACADYERSPMSRPAQQALSRRMEVSVG